LFACVAYGERHTSGANFTFHYPVTDSNGFHNPLFNANQIAIACETHHYKHAGCAARNRLEIPTS
jgi:hypothetical protein